MKQIVNIPERFCLECDKKLQRLVPSQIKQGRGKYCSNRCTNLGKNSHMWKENVKYTTVHKWLFRHYGHAETCSHCGIKGEKKGRMWTIEWANAKEVYERNIENFIPLCRSCHRIFDALRRGGIYNQSGFHKLRNKNYSLDQFPKTDIFT